MLSQASPLPARCSNKQHCEDSMHHILTPLSDDHRRRSTPVSILRGHPLADHFKPTKCKSETWQRDSVICKFTHFNSTALNI